MRVTNVAAVCKDLRGSTVRIGNVSAYVPIPN